MIYDFNFRFTEEILSLYNLELFVPKILISTIDDFTILLFESIWGQFEKIYGMSNQFVNKEDFITTFPGKISYLWWRKNNGKKILIFQIQL